MSFGWLFKNSSKFGLRKCFVNPRPFCEDARVLKPTLSRNAPQTRASHVNRHQLKPERATRSFPRRDPPPNVIFAAGFRALGEKLHNFASPSPVTSFLLHLGIGCYFFVHYVASLRATAGPSMLPTLAVSGDFALVSWLHARGHRIKTGDIISYEHPIHRGERAIKRVIAMEGDYVLTDTPGGLNGELQDVTEKAHEKPGQETARPSDQTLMRVPKGHCWVVGDNLSWSRDSRMYGPIPLALVRGKVLAIKKPGWPWQGWRPI